MRLRKIASARTTTRARKKDLPRVSRFWRIFALFRRFVAQPKTSGIILVITGCWAFYQGGSYQAAASVANTISQHVAKAFNLNVANVYLEGQTYTKTGDILAATDVKIGQPLLGVDLWAIKHRLEALTWIKYSVVERQYPSTLSISLVERQPLALWQNNGKVHLIDESGESIDVADLKPFSNLIILVGADAPSYATDLFAMISSTPELQKMVSSAIRVGERRWDIRLYNGIEIKLPEDNPEKAWKYLADLHKKEHLLDSDIQNIDLRIPGKMYTKQRT